MLDVISIGDSVIDVFVPIEEAQLTQEANQINLSFPFGRKVPVGESRSLVAGNACNNAVGSVRLGLKTAIYTNVGKQDDDRADHRIKEKLKSEGVDTRYIIENPDLPSNHSVILEYKGERTILVHHQPWKFNLPDLEKTKWVYLTSLSPSFEQSNIVEQIIHFVQINGSKLAYQPGTFQLKQGAKKQARLLSLTEILILNLEEAKFFLGHKMTSNINIKKLLKELLDLGPKKVVITNSKEGAYGATGEQFFKMGTFPSQMVQVTGAGDAYATATVAGLIYGKDLEEAMRWGSANSASVIQNIGTQTGLLSLNKLQESLKENSKITAKEI